jgi:hypothetical protein
MSHIVFAVVISVVVTSAAFIVFIRWTHHEHRGAHARHDINLTAGALAQEPIHHGETHREFLERMRHHQARRDNPPDAVTGRHHVPQVDADTDVPSERAERRVA